MSSSSSSFFFFNGPSPTEIYTLSLHDALPISLSIRGKSGLISPVSASSDNSPHCRSPGRSEEHTSELQSQSNLVCRLLLEKKKKRRSRQAMSEFRSFPHADPSPQRQPALTGFR